MSPSPHTRLTAAGLATSVQSMINVLDTGNAITVMVPVAVLTKGMLVELFRISDRCNKQTGCSRSRRLVDLMHGLGYVPFVGRSDEKTWDTAAKRLWQTVTKAKKKSDSFPSFDQPVSGCTQPGNQVQHRNPCRTECAYRIK